MGENYTLRDIERGILLRQFGDPKICFALSYASLGGSSLVNKPYIGETLAGQLEEQAQAFISSERGFRIDRGKKRAYLSVVFKPSWYGNYFLKRYTTDKNFIDKEPFERAALNFISNYIPRKDKDFLIRKDYTIKYMKYNWTLNEQ